MGEAEGCVLGEGEGGLAVGGGRAWGLAPLGVLLLLLLPPPDTASRMIITIWRGGEVRW